EPPTAGCPSCRSREAAEVGAYFEPAKTMVSEVSLAALRRAQSTSSSSSASTTVAPDFRATESGVSRSGAEPLGSIATQRSFREGTLDSSANAKGLKRGSSIQFRRYLTGVGPDVKGCDNALRYEVLPVVTSSMPGSSLRFGCTTISMRRLARRPSSVELSPTGSSSAKPAAERRLGSMPSAIMSLVTSTARAVESSQFDLNLALLIGMLSVWPATWNLRPSIPERIDVT